MKTFVIAEAGANHNRDWKTATQLIDVAVQAKSAAVKFQTYSADTLYAQTAKDVDGLINVHELIKNNELPRSWQKDLKKYCDDKNIEFMSTPFDNKAVDELFNIGVKRLKIAGFEATDPRFVRYIAQTGLPLIVSAGIGCSLNKIQDIMRWIKEENLQPDITILHCNNAYPTPMSDICLGQMLLIKKEYPAVKIGLSDHTLGILIPPVAVALGAQVIEKHYTLDKSHPGPDHSFAIEPEELKNMINNISDIESSLRVQEKLYTNSEENHVQARRSVVTLSNVKKGTTASANNITTMRPLVDEAIPAEDFYSCLGKKFSSNLGPNAIIKKHHLE